MTDFTAVLYRQEMCVALKVHQSLLTASGEVGNRYKVKALLYGCYPTITKAAATSVSYFD